MKKMAKLFFVFLLAVGLTGCVKYNASMEIKNDKSVTLEIIYGVDAEMMSGNIEEGDNEFVEDATAGEDDDWSSDDDWITDDEDDDWITDDEDDDDASSGVEVEDYKYLEDLGYKVEKFEETKDDSTITGVKITKTFDNIDDITADKEVTVNFIELFNEENKDKLKDAKFFYKDGNKYVANFVFDFLEGVEDSERESAASYDAYITDLSYSVKLPTEAKEHNASKASEDGKELTWDLTYSKVNKVNFAFALGNNLLPIILGVVAGLVVVAVVVVVILVVGKKKKTNPMVNGTMPMNGPQPMNNVQNPNNNIQ